MWGWTRIEGVFCLILGMIQLFVVRYTKMQDKDEEKQTLLAEDEFAA